MAFKSTTIKPNDKGCNEVGTEKTKTTAEFPNVGNEEAKNSNMKSGLVPDGKGGAVVDK